MSTQFKLLICLCIVPLIGSPTIFAQNIAENLIKSRAELLLELEEIETQRRPLIGKNSRRELKNTTEILKEIVEKDTEIISALQKEIIRIEADRADPDYNNRRVIELENELARLTNVANQRNIKKAELEQEVAIIRDRMFQYQSTILIGIFIMFILAFYISRLRKKSLLRDQVVRRDQVTLRDQMALRDQVT